MVISNFLKFGMVKLFKNLHNIVDVDTLLTQIKYLSKSTSFYF